MSLLLVNCFSFGKFTIPIAMISKKIMVKNWRFFFAYFHMVAIP